MLERLLIQLEYLLNLFTDSYMFKKDGNPSIMSFLSLNGCNKLSRFIHLDHRCKDLRLNPLQEWEDDAEQAMKIDFFLQAKVMVQMGTMMAFVNKT